MESSCLKTSFVNLANRESGTVVDASELDLVSFFFFCSSGLCLLLLPAEGPSIPNTCICSLFGKLPQILEAASIPSASSDSIAICQKDGEVQQGKTRLVAVLFATKTARHVATQVQSVITHQCEHLQKVLCAMQVFRKPQGRKHLVTQKTFVIHHFCHHRILQHQKTTLS